MGETFILGTGESRMITGSIFGKAVHMVYCGINSENTFSIGLLSSKGNRGHGLNLFFPKRASYIMIDKQKYYVINVTPENITLQTPE
ncbi:hypothetical protein V7O62_09655 [Methanolobus sp. ZRKC2]|uniref:hypothetical protein n=1 Tax=Methanolobus sp. ZRKC2 TaxID=3125783 RepID=UPI003246AF35